MKAPASSIPSPAAFGRRIRALRERRKLTQAEVARSVGMDRADLCNIEKGRGPAVVGSKRVVGLASALGVSPSTLLKT